MAQEQGVVVRRAKPSDASTIASFINHVLGKPSVDDLTIIQTFGDEGFFVAERAGNLVGLLGWRAENLVVRVTHLLIWPASEYIAAGPKLFAEMEDAAATLECEAALLLPPRKQLSPRQIEFFGGLGYKPQSVAGLPKAWREAALEGGLGEEDPVLVKQLRERRVLRPM
jgi:N-acetylglutamate synthase-like GNAT family acetyltransferase